MAGAGANFQKKSWLTVTYTYQVYVFTHFFSKKVRYTEGSSALEPLQSVHGPEPLSTAERVEQRYRSVVLGEIQS